MTKRVGGPEDLVGRGCGSLPDSVRLAAHADYLDRCGRRSLADALRRAIDAAASVLDGIPSGSAKVDGEWIKITSDGVGYGEFDRDGSPAFPVEPWDAASPAEGDDDG